jgi:hypothetical protein
MLTWIKNIWTNPKSSVTAIIAIGLLATELAKDYPTARWIGIAATVLGAIAKLLMTDSGVNITSIGDTTTTTTKLDGATTTTTTKPA